MTKLASLALVKLDWWLEMKRTMTPVVILMASLWLLVGCSGPLGPIAGGALQGTHAEVPSSWAAIAEVEHVKLETINSGKPRSVLIWVGTAENRLYVATSLISGSSNPEDRTWVQNVTENPDVRLQVEDRIYLLRAVRELDPARMEVARAALMLKYDVELDSQSSSAWIYELSGR